MVEVGYLSEDECLCTFHQDVNTMQIQGDAGVTTLAPGSEDALGSA